ncbi:MAG: ATP-binding protein [Actinomycetota bacterium]|nr:ATP-binding protein [Actinomycetota bacterium]
MAARLFDLNIEEVLDNWEVSHALREIISNAFDEQALSDTDDVLISKDDDERWSISDFGRGLRIEHFTLNENQEKLAAPSGVIGKFGVGLKDALATFHRRGIGVTITSAHGVFTLEQTHKHGFDDITTLHVRYDEAPTGRSGTSFAFDGVSEAQIDEAKAFFLKFGKEEQLERTRYGEVLSGFGDGGRVYISGVFASEEPSFLFSYNVTDLTDVMKKRLNRERLNVGRTTYSDRVKSMLKEATSDAVRSRLADEIRRRTKSPPCDELTWIDIAQVALTHLARTAEVIFVTEQELHRNPDVMDHARRDGLEIVLVTSAEKTKLVQQAEAGGEVTRTFENYVEEFNQSFSYSFVEREQLAHDEREVLALTERLVRLVGVPSRREPRVLVSETMRMTIDDTDGVWDPELAAIVIKRDVLRTKLAYASTLLHEVAHATTGTIDATRAFEAVLTGFLGQTSLAALEAEG